jgi:hypothetical protein
MIEKIFHAMNELIFYELDERECNKKMRRKERMLPFYREKVHGKSHIAFDFNAEDFLANKFFKANTILDAYGTVEYDIDGISTILLNTYGEEDIAKIKRFSRRSPYVSIFTICIIYNNKIEVADVVTSRSVLPRKKMKILNHMIGDIPKELQGISFQGKRAFYFNDKGGAVSLRLKDEDYADVPDKYKHIEAKGWVSGPRVKVKVIKVDKEGK